jgi:hypothetical protein
MESDQGVVDHGSRGCTASIMDHRSGSRIKERHDVISCEEAGLERVYSDITPPLCHYVSEWLSLHVE